MYIFSEFLYGLKAWTMTETMCEKLEAFQMYAYRIILEIPWTIKVTNIEIFGRLKKSVGILNSTKRCKLEYFGHVMCSIKYQLLHIIIQGIESKREPGRRSTS